MLNIIGKKIFTILPRKMYLSKPMIATRGDQKVRGKVLLNRIANIDFNEN